MSKTKRYFPQFVAYTFGEDWICPKVEVLEEYMQRNVFKAIGPTQELTFGWVPPRGNEYDPLVESVDGQLFFKCKIQTKKVPSAILNQELDVKVKATEALTGRRVGKKEKKELKQEVLLELLPKTFPQTKQVYCWLDRESRRLIFDTGTIGATDDVVTMLVDMFNELKHAINLRLLTTKQSPQSSMAHWLTTFTSPPNFSIDRDVLLKSSDESKATIKYSSHALDINEIVEHVGQGKLPTQLAMTFEDRLSFVLTESFVFKGVQCLDTMFEEDAENGSFDVDMTLITAELRKMLDELVEALGGLFVISDEALPAQLAAT